MASDGARADPMEVGRPRAVFVANPGDTASVDKPKILSSHTISALKRKLQALTDILFT